MQLVRQFALPIGLFVVLVGMMGIGFASSQTGFMALGLLCFWPLLWAAVAWSFRGLKDTYQLVPKAKSQRQRQANSNEVYS